MQRLNAKSQRTGKHSKVFVRTSYQKSISAIGGKTIKEENVYRAVRERYGKITKTKKESCGCYGGPSSREEIGYSKVNLTSVSDSAALNLGCGNPVAFASLKEGETVIDFDSGRGLDCFLISKKVWTKGKVIGIDMIAEMIERARKLQERQASFDRSALVIFNF